MRKLNTTMARILIIVRVASNYNSKKYSHLNISLLKDFLNQTRPASKYNRKILWQIAVPIVDLFLLFYLLIIFKIFQFNL